MGDLFDAFLIGSDSCDNSGFGGLNNFLEAGLEEEEAKRQEKKKKGKTKEKTSVKAVKKDVTIKDFPVMIRARGFAQSYGTEGDAPKALSELLSDLVATGYVEAAFGGCYVGNTVYILTPSVSDKAADDDRILENCVVADGLQRMEVTAEAFDVTADELSAEMVLDRWVENNPLYEGCLLAVKNKSATPNFALARRLLTEDELELPLQVFYDGECHTLTDTDFFSEKVIVKDVVKHIYGDVPKELSITLAKNQSEDVYFVCMDSNKKVLTADDSAVLSASQKVVEKYSVPLKIFVATFGLSIQLTPSDFDGKEKVSLDEIKAHLAKSYTIFSDKSRKLDSIYIEESNTLSLMFISGKKGAVRTEKLPYGIITGITTEDGRISEVAFDFQGDKIPYEIYEQIIDFFRMKMPNEASCRICHDGEKYVMVDTTGTADRFTVNTVIPKELNDPSITHVLDVHSHNSMAAVFSVVDDADEIWQGLFMVVGRLNEPTPEVSIRAGLEGVFSPVSFTDIFEEVTG